VEGHREGVPECIARGGSIERGGGGRRVTNNERMSVGMYEALYARHL
jgi:hypothetical protein